MMDEPKVVLGRRVFPDTDGVWVSHDDSVMVEWMGDRVAGCWTVRATDFGRTFTALARGGTLQIAENACRRILRRIARKTASMAGDLDVIRKVDGATRAPGGRVHGPPLESLHGGAYGTPDAMSTMGTAVGTELDEEADGCEKTPLRRA